MKTAMLVLSLCAGCAVERSGAERTERSAVATEDSVLGASCTVRRPNQWGTSGHLCVERFTTPLVLPDGEFYETISQPGPRSGEGTLTLFCDNGTLELIESTCS